MPEKDLPRVPPTEPDKVLATFQIKKIFRLDLITAEPLVVDSILITFEHIEPFSIVVMICVTTEGYMFNVRVSSNYFRCDLNYRIHAANGAGGDPVVLVVY